MDQWSGTVPLSSVAAGVGPGVPKPNFSKNLVLHVEDIFLKSITHSPAFRKITKRMRSLPLARFILNIDGAYRLGLPREGFARRAVCPSLNIPLLHLVEREQSLGRSVRPPLRSLLGHLLLEAPPASVSPLVRLGGGPTVTLQFDTLPNSLPPSHYMLWWEHSP